MFISSFFLHCFTEIRRSCAATATVLNQARTARGRVMIINSRGNTRAPTHARTHTPTQMYKRKQASSEQISNVRDYNQLKLMKNTKYQQ